LSGYANAWLLGNSTPFEFQNSDGFSSKIKRYLETGGGPECNLRRALAGGLARATAVTSNTRQAPYIRR
jgi:hypothetical protein